MAADSLVRGRYPTTCTARRRTRRSIVTSFPVTAGFLVAPFGSAWYVMADLTLTSPAFDDGDSIPEEHGYSAENTNPPLQIDGVPTGAESLALVVDDPDAREPAGEDMGSLGRLERRHGTLGDSCGLAADQRRRGTERLR